MNPAVSNTQDSFSNAYMAHIFKLAAFHPMLFDKTYEFVQKDKDENRLYLSLNDKINFAISLKRISMNSLDVYVKIPKKFTCKHYDGNKISKVCSLVSSINTHLTYHVKTRKKKISGEIHIKEDGKRIGADVQNCIEAPLLTSQDINTFPLPVCKLYFKKDCNPISLFKNVDNCLYLSKIKYHINTIDIFLAKRTCFNRILQAKNKLDYILGFLLGASSLNMFAEGQLGWSYEIDNRYSDFVRVYRLPYNDFEILAIISDDKRMIHNNALDNILIYFKTKDYIKNLFDRYVIENKDGIYLGVAKGPSPNVQDWNKLKDLL